MISGEPMTREDLIQNAALDAFGLLDEYEASLFSRSFHHAAVAVQDEILRLQAEVSMDPALMADEQPDDLLRDRVLAAVARAVEREATRLAPLATIGGRKPANESQTPTRMRLPASGLFWRAAVFALAASVVVMAYLLTQANQQGHLISRLALDNNTAAQLERLIGPTFKDFFFDQQARRVVLQPVSRNSTCRGALYVKDLTKDAILVFEGLPRGAEGSAYSLLAVDEGGRSHVLATFSGSEDLAGQQFTVEPLSVAAVVRWEIRDAEGVVVLTA